MPCIDSAMNRAEAIEKLIEKQLEALPLVVRKEQLSIMCLEDWSGTSKWGDIPEEVRHELESGELTENEASSRYDKVLLLWLGDRLAGATNEYVTTLLASYGIPVEIDGGEPLSLESCPCCGRRTIEIRGEYEICTVCWWEDDGQDNDTASTVYGGPNYGISLTQARYNFLKYGIYDPNRSDLLSKREPANKYVPGRKFRLVDGNTVIELDSEWSAQIDSIAL